MATAQRESGRASGPAKGQRWASRWSTQGTPAGRKGGESDCTTMLTNRNALKADTTVKLRTGRTGDCDEREARGQQPETQASARKRAAPVSGSGQQGNQSTGRHEGGERDTPGRSGETFCAGGRHFSKA